MAKKLAKKSLKPKTLKPTEEFDDSPGVSALIATMAHPMNQIIEGIRKTILAADSEITEGIKWNSPSFYCNGWFATINARKPSQLEIVFHHGAKIRRESSIQEAIDDPGLLLKWPSADRAIMRLAEDVDFKKVRPQLKSIVQHWAAYQKKITKI